jgi:hypothetical protein
VQVLALVQLLAPLEWVGVLELVQVLAPQLVVLVVVEAQAQAEVLELARELPLEGLQVLVLELA